MRGTLLGEMSVTLLLDLTPEQEERLVRRASRVGVAPADYLRRLIDSDAGVAHSVELAAIHIGPDQADDLRRRLRTFVEDWERPEMDVYDAL
jgi:hypothetical protein